MESISKKSKKVIEEHLEELSGRHPLIEITRIGARMALQVAIEEELCILLQRDYYERKEQAGSRNGSKMRAVNMGCGEVEIAIRTTNAVERSFREVRGRVRGIGRFKDDERALTMVYWQIKELRWHGVDVTAEAKAILAKIRASKLEKIAA